MRGSIPQTKSSSGMNEPMAPIDFRNAGKASTPGVVGRREASKPGPNG
jgi:hypothetical protein